MAQIRWPTILVLLPLLLLMVAACGDDDGEANSTTPAEVPTIPVKTQVETLRVQLALDWYPNANHVGLFVAE